MFGKRTWHLALPIPWLITLAVAVVVLLVLVHFYGRGPTVMFGWLIGWLVASRLVNYVVSRRRPKRGDS